MIRYISVNGCRAIFDGLMIKQQCPNDDAYAFRSLMPDFWADVEYPAMFAPLPLPHRIQLQEIPIAGHYRPAFTGRIFEMIDIRRVAQTHCLASDHINAVFRQLISDGVMNMPIRVKPQ